MKEVLITILSAAISTGASSQPAQSSNSKAVQGSGCVEKAVESSCHVLTDSKTGEIYNLLFAGTVPKNGTAIWFKGSAHQGMTTCMQGKPVNVKKWKKEKGIKCPPASVPTKTH